MYSQIGRTAAIFALLSLAACATPFQVHRSLPQTAQSKFSSTDVIVPIEQKEIMLFIPEAGFGKTWENGGSMGGGGVIGTLVATTFDAVAYSISKSKADTALKPLRASLKDFDFDGTLVASVKTSLSAVAWLHIDNVSLVKAADNNTGDGTLVASKAAAVMYTTTWYNFSNNGDTLYINMSASIFPKSPELSEFLDKNAIVTSPKTSLSNSIYRNIMTYEIALKGMTEDRDHNIALWNTNNGAPVRTALKQGAEKIANMLVMDLQGSFGQGKESIVVDGVRGTVANRDAEGVTVIFLPGTLQYVASETMNPAASK